MIYYTTNGTEPTEHAGLRYNAPIKITTTTVLRAKAFADGKETSATGTQTISSSRTW